MSDGMSDAKREETAARMLQRACSALESVLEETTDAAFGPNATVVHELNRSAGQYGLKFVVFDEARDAAELVEVARSECVRLRQALEEISQSIDWDANPAAARLLRRAFAEEKKT